MKSRSLIPLLPTVVVATAIAMVLISPSAGRAAASSHHSYFVAPTGSDAVACASNTAAAPFGTIQRALACTSDGDTIDLAPSAGQPYPGIGVVAHSVTIQAQRGADARSVSIDAGKGPLTVEPGAEVALNGVNLSCLGNDCGGSPTVTDEGSLSLTADEITGNLVHGAILQTTPTGSSSPSALSVNGSTISGNAGPSGGAIDVLAGEGAVGALTLTLANSTIAGNFAQHNGGGVSFIAATRGSGATITNTTITANGAQAAGGGLSSTGYVHLDNTILAGNTTRIGQHPDCHDEGFPSETHIVDGPAGHNLIGNGAGCAGLTGPDAGDVIGAPHAGLLALADNGGPTDTVALQAASPALSAGEAVACAAAPIGDRDQRGEARKSGARGCDIGAYDTAGSGGTVDRTYFVAPAGSDSPTCSANSATAPFATIQRALECATDGDVVNLAPTGAKPYPGVGTLTHNVTIEAGRGASARTVAIDAGREEIAIAPGVNADLTDVALGCPGNDCIGVPTVTDEGALTLTGDQLTGNLGLGGAILETTPAKSSTSASLHVLSSTISENVTTDGGAVDAIPGTGATGPVTLAIADSTIAGNLARAVGGAISFNATTPGSSATIASSTITGNAAQNGGGGIAATGHVTLADTILAANTARVSPASSDCQDEGFPRATHVLDGPAGHNVIGNRDGCPGLAAAGAGDQAGVTEGPLDPQLGPLAYNGGTAETVPLLAGSPAIGAASAAGCEAPPVASEDERGRSRDAQTRGVCDVGAYDTSGLAPAAVLPKIHAPAAHKGKESAPLLIKLKGTGAPTAVLSESGALPEGVRFIDHADGTAEIAGTPASGAAGSYPVVITARNGVGSASASLELTVRP